MKKGYIQVYTGDGKGKTTAALGLGFRAIGRGLKVYMVQFLKGGETGEISSIKKHSKDFKIFRYGDSKKFFYLMSEIEKKELKDDVGKGIRFIRELMKKRECDILILDEVMGILSNELLSIKELCDVLIEKPESMELVLTGRNAPAEIIEIADLVTEMKPIKHYYDRGVKARVGIEK